MMSSAKLDSNDRKDGATTDGEDFLKFELGDATVYSRVCKQLLNEAKATVETLPECGNPRRQKSAWLSYCV
jgi:hypothetical protein